MAQNFLYMFEFVVDDLLITRPNHCAPEEYPTCCEISFRSSVFVSICDREFGQCVDTCAPKCGKCCLFSLESPVSDKDRLHIHIYKKKTDKCKFLVGATDIPIKPLFDKVTESFNIENPNWVDQVAKHKAEMPDMKTSKTTIVDNDCDEEPQDRREQLCPTSELTKRLLPLFNMKHCQTGNLVLIMRLVCNGPTIVSSFPFSRICGSVSKKQLNCPPCTPCPPPPCHPCPQPFPQPSPQPCPPPCPLPKPSCGGPCVMPDPCAKPEPKKQICRRYFACNADKGCPCENCEDDRDRECPTGCPKKKCPRCPRCPAPPCCPQPDPCKKSIQRADMCQRFFGNSDSDKNCCCPCEECVDECEAECSDECSEQCMQPCFVTPSKPDPGPEAYEEFEACLNGSGLVIRVLKDTHKVENIIDGTEQGFDDSGSECDKCPRDNSQPSHCECISDILQRSTIARNHIKRRTAGHIVNNSRLPRIRANIKYSGNDSCCSQRYHVPFSKVKQFCEAQENKLDLYRRKNACDESCGPLVTPLPALDIRNCCLQVDPQDIKNTLKGINTDTRKKGIEVCYKTCDDTDSDVFLVKLGSKQRCQQKKNSIEIELKTPKQPHVMPKQKVTTETQINEAELDRELTCGKKKKKGRKGKKGKKK